MRFNYFSYFKNVKYKGLIQSNFYTLFIKLLHNKIDYVIMIVYSLQVWQV